MTGESNLTECRGSARLISSRLAFGPPNQPNLSR